MRLSLIQTHTLAHLVLLSEVSIPAALPQEMLRRASGIAPLASIVGPQPSLVESFETPEAPSEHRLEADSLAWLHALMHAHTHSPVCLGSRGPHVFPPD